MSRLPDFADCRNDRILTLDDAAALFGVSVKTFIKLLREEEVPARKIGREWRFSSEALLAWLGRGSSRAYSDSEQEVKRFFDALAPAYGTMQDRAFDTALLKALELFCPPSETGLVIDYGAGTGLVAQWAANHRASVLAMDVSSGMLAELNRQAGLRKLQGITTLLCLSGEVPAEEQSAERIYASLCFHHLAEPEETVASFRRILTADGKLAVVELDPYMDDEWQAANHDTWPGIDREELKTWVRASGFQTVEFPWEMSLENGKSCYLMVAE